MNERHSSSPELPILPAAIGALADGWGRAILAVVLAAGLIFGLTWQGRALLAAPDRVRARDPNNQVNSIALKMGDWIEANVPPGEGILTTWLYSAQLAFQDGTEHRWTLGLELDCVYRPADRASPVCAADTGEPQPWPPNPDLIWLQMHEGCGATALTESTLLRQLRQSDSSYLLVTREPGFPGVLSWVPNLVQDGAFEVEYATYLRQRPSIEQARGLVLLRWNGDGVGSRPTRMNSESVARLIECERALRGERYAAAIRTAFPQGIWVTGPEAGMTEAREAIARIYGDGLRQ